MEIGYINGMNLGVGFNTASYELHPAPALDDVSQLRPVVSAGGQEVYFNVQLASSTLSLTEQLNVSARASLKYGISNSGSAKTSFLSSFKQNSFSIYVLVQTIVTNKQTLLDLSKIRLESQAANLFVNNPQAFIQQFGDAFVYGLITGGEFIGVLEIESSNSAEFREIKAKLSGKASWGLFSGNGSATFQESLQKITSSFQMKASVLRRGGTGELNVVTPEQLVKDALEFPRTVANDEGFPYTALVIPYNHIPHPVASPLDVSHQITVLEQLGAYRQRLIKYQNDLTYAKDHPEQFQGIDIQQVEDRFNQISPEILSIVSSARDCYSDFSRCNLPQLNFSLLENILPPQIDKKGRDSTMQESVGVRLRIIGSDRSDPGFFIATGSKEAPLVTLQHNNGYPSVKDVYARGADHNGKQGVIVHVRFDGIPETSESGFFSINLAQPNMTGDFTANQVW